MNPAGAQRVDKEVPPPKRPETEERRAAAAANGDRGAEDPAQGRSAEVAGDVARRS